jgi:hypothetical protein
MLGKRLSDGKGAGAQLINSLGVRCHYRGNQSDAEPMPATQWYVLYRERYAIGSGSGTPSNTRRSLRWVGGP